MRCLLLVTRDGMDHAPFDGVHSIWISLPMALDGTYSVQAFHCARLSVKYYTALVSAGQAALAPNPPKNINQ